METRRRTGGSRLHDCARTTPSQIRFSGRVALQELSADGAKLAGEQFGGYAQSSGSGNANIVVWRQ
jgi:hypothetical protein